MAGPSLALPMAFTSCFFQAQEMKQGPCVKIKSQGVCGPHSTWSLVPENCRAVASLNNFQRKIYSSSLFSSVSFTQKDGACCRNSLKLVFVARSTLFYLATLKHIS